MSGVRWEEISEAAKDLVSQLLVMDPRSRMSAKYVLQHTWFNDDEATVTQARLVVGLDNEEGGDKGVGLEELWLRKDNSIIKSPPKYLLSRASVILIWQLREWLKKIVENSNKGRPIFHIVCWITML